MSDLQTRYLERLSELYPTVAAASTEVINLEAILNLPKGTEHFLTDIHGEYEALTTCLKTVPERTEEGQRRVRQHLKQAGQADAGYPYLLSQRKDGPDFGEGEQSRGLVQDYPVPAH